MNIITGLPRAGSTLLCNILNQNPKNFASDTSILAGAVQAVITSVSEQLEAQDLPYEVLKNMVMGVINAKYPELADRTVYDKGRLWTRMGLQYQDLKLGKMFVLVRDLRDVYASMERAHRKNPLLAPSHLISSNDVFTRADLMFSPEGMVGSCVAGIEDLIRRDLDNVVFIQYEKLVTDPETMMKQFDDFEYQFDDVINVANENDKAYMGKYPHNGSGKVTGKSINSWKGLINDDLAQMIQARFPLYTKTFGY